MGRWRAKHAVSAVAVFAVLTVIVALTVLWWPAEQPQPVLPTLQPTPLKSAKSGSCVIVDGDAEESRAFQFGCTDTPGRTWYLRPAAGAGTVEHLFRIVNASNGKCLSYSDEFLGGARVVVQRSCASDNDQGQLWSFVFDPARGDGWIYGRLTNMRSSRCLDINNELVDDGTPVIQWDCGEKSNQLFKVMKEPVS
ncbi:MAG: RICIN domain-containing protein [Pseudonocardiaceae bacterium]